MEDGYCDSVTFDAVKLVFDVVDELTEEEFEKLRENRDIAEMEVQGDCLALSGGLPCMEEKIEI